MHQPDPVHYQFFSQDYARNFPGEEGKLIFSFHLSGSHTVRIGKSTFDFGESVAFIVPSTCELSLRGRGKTSLLTISLTCLGAMLRTGAGAALSSVLPSAKDGPFRVYSLSAHTVSRLEPILQTIAEETALRRSDYLDMVHFQLYELFLLLRREGSAAVDELKRWSGSGGVWNIDRIVEYITANYDSPFSLDNLAARCGLNPSYFSRLFREKTGIPLFEYINRLRIDRASLMLKNKGHTVLEIAMAVGYNNVSFFNRYFRRLRGCSPGEFRRKMEK